MRAMLVDDWCEAAGLRLAELPDPVPGRGEVAIDVKAIGCDFLACSAYKFYGPHIGILHGRKELLESTDFPKLRPSPDAAPERAETGTLGQEAIAGAAATVEFIA